MPHQLNKIMDDFAKDPITGFLNRNGCFTKLSQLANSCSGQPLSVIWIALDRFKPINASFGHHGGDTVITQIAQRLRSRAGIHVHWFRMSGDEFVCLVPNSDFDHTHQLATTLLRKIELPLSLDNLLLHPSASLGIATLGSDEDPAACLERADRAMNTAKRAGGDRVIASGSEPLPGRMGVHLARQELELENKLHLALKQGGLSLHYQPCVDADGRIVSIEALMRFTNHQLAPEEFIPIAEKTGLIVRLGEWSLLEGARFAHRLDLAGQHIPISVNVSHAQLTIPRFAQTLHAALLCANISPDLIELELTESLFSDQSTTVQANLRAAHEAGVKITIDNFGTGYACLASLKDITASKIKIDSAFVAALPHDKRALVVVKAIAQMCNELGILAIAEGVETQSQLDLLLEVGIHCIQGFIYARPMPEKELLTWLQHRKTT